MERVQVPYVVSGATLDDSNAIRDLIAKYPENLLQTHLPNTTDFFVAKVGGVLVACCALEIFYKPGEANPRLAEIRSLAVMPEFKNAGIGTALVRACLEKAEATSVYEVFAFTDKLEFFEKLGISTFNGAKYAVFRVLGK